MTLAPPSIPATQKVIRLAHRPTSTIEPPSHFLPLSHEPVPSFPSQSKYDGKGTRLVLLHRLFISLDPAMRGWMSSAKSYLPPVPIGEVMRGATLSEVVAIQDADTNSSAKRRLQVGDIVSDFSSEGGWQEFVIVPENSVRRVESMAELLQQHDSTPRDLPLTIHLSILGTTGLTAYFGFINVGCPRVPKAGSEPETVLVTAAAGAVGTIVCQIAKFVYGCKVIGVAGGQSKCKLLKEELKCCDAVIDYRSMENGVEASAGLITPSEILAAKSKQFQSLLRQALKSIESKGIDIMFDNVGGYMLTQSLYCLKTHSRVVVCGAISGYNADSTQQAQPLLSVKHGMALISLRAKIQGFVVLDYIKEWGAAKRQLCQWIQEGKIQYQMEDVRVGLENAPEALLDLFRGRNTGKLVVKVGDRMTVDIVKEKEGFISKL